MTLAEDRLPIGSFFESPSCEILSDVTVPPWEQGEPVTYVQTARQALAALARYMSKEGRHKLLAPDYLCASMLEGFSRSEWEIDVYRMKESLIPDAHDLLRKVRIPRDTVVLGASYFGQEPSEEYMAAITALRYQGVRVIEDETHRVLGDLPPVGDVAIASLRKLLPVADGAYVRGSYLIEGEVDRHMSGWQAMDEKASGYIERARQKYALANSFLGSWLTPPAHVSLRTLNTLKRLDYSLLRERRRANARVLRSLLEALDIEVLNKSEVPSHVVIRLSSPSVVQNKLASVGIFCPIHWPQPKRWSGRPWRNDLLSLPIDHRYGAEDMERIARELKRTGT